MTDNGVSIVCGFGVVYRCVHWFDKANDVALFFGLLGCCSLREVWRMLP